MTFVPVFPKAMTDLKQVSLLLEWIDPKKSKHFVYP